MEENEIARPSGVEGLEAKLNPMPSQSAVSIEEREDFWSKDVFKKSLVHKTSTDKKKNKDGIADYYRLQNDIIKGYVEMHNFIEMSAQTEALIGEEQKYFLESNIENPNSPQARANKDEKAASDVLSKLGNTAVFVTALTNMLLMGVKLGIVIASSSLVLIASLIDSVLDIVSSFVLYFASKSSLAKNKYKYPVGKHRLEPLGIVAFSAIMGMTSLIIILESIKGIVDGYTSSSEVTVEFSYIAAIVLGIVIVVKLCLYFLCKYIQHRIMQLSGGRINHTVEAMYEDHINDVVSNAFALVIALISSNYNSVWVLDPLGALLIAAIIMKGWLQKGAQQGKLLVGRSASNEFIGKLAFLAIKHDDRILAVDTIYAYHSGINLIVEIHIVLPEEMPLRIAHDIGDSLERRLEALPSVERAFVHMDIDFLHKPEH